MEVRITTLSENTATYGYIAEWGLSILVEVEGARILMDTGLSFSATHNAQIAGIDLTSIDRIVLSHGHADHTGGLYDLLKKTGEIEIVAHPDIWDAKYVQRGQGETERYIGIPFRRETLEDLGAKFNLTSEPVHIANHVMTTGQIPMRTEYEQIGSHLCIHKDGISIPDKLADDLALIINTDFGLVVILGCAHRGVINTLNHARDLTGNETVYAVIGGTHLFLASDEQINKTIVDLKKLGVQRLLVSHCTGFRASSRLAQKFGDGFVLNNAGSQFTLP
ncbi:MAG: MBL fold metallo-hydrolase [Chloroflexi bacterium]|jgi:7,8-dihydropterin-6-yl-methyl-4-(beta-D-ribofuranosyl)aminobenzene 5'-phosphate synthase|nr:MBL fold metallo-hydrolase [Chloroflexota bacterium]MBT7081680.1 MBL fold metallo-hydrolase [Chloroflexota bacterium]MBT7288944.1 MBL fold metallo-hydrolase [Chloroflexota bacterium]